MQWLKYSKSKCASTNVLCSNNVSITRLSHQTLNALFLTNGGITFSMVIQNKKKKKNMYHFQTL